MNMVFDASVRRLSCGKLKSETTTTDAINVHIEQRKTYRRPSKCAKLQGIKSHILISVTFCVPLWCGGELGMSLNGFQLNSNGFIDSTEQAANAWIKSQYLQLWNVSFFSYNAGKSWKPIRRINLMNLSWQIGFVRHKNSWRNYNSQISHPAIPIQYALICGFWWNVIHQLIKKNWKMTNPAFMVFLWDRMKCARLSTFAWSSNEIDSSLILHHIQWKILFMVSYQIFRFIHILSRFHF